MKISVIVKPGRRTTSLLKRDENHYIATVKAAAIDGKANEALIALLAQELNVAKSMITIRRGQTSKRKIVEIL